MLVMPNAQPPDVVLVAEALGNGAALVLTAVLFMLILRTARSNFAMWLAAFCALLWSGASLTTCLLILSGGAPNSTAVWIAMRAAMASGVIFPISFILLWPLPEPAVGWRVETRRWLLIVSTGVAALVLVALASAKNHPRGGRMHLMMSFIPFIAALLMTIGAVIILHGRLKTLADRVYVVLTLMGLWLCGIAILLLDHFAFSPGACAALTLVKEQAPFLTLIGSIFFFARFRAADVLIKSSLKITVGTQLALIAALIISNPPPLADGHKALYLCITTMLLGLLLLVYLAASRAVTFAVDRWVLPRPDYRAALRAMWTELNTLDTEPAIFDAARTRIHSLLESRKVDVLPTNGEVSADGLFPHEGQAYNDCDIQAPVRVRGERAYILAVTQERFCRALLSADLRFLEDTAALIGGRIETLLAERERIERQAREARLLQLAAESELKALRAQINPHFLFNSLNTIADLIVTDPPKAETITVLLAKVFRHVLLYSDRQLTAVSEEIEFLRTYLRIEEVRFGPRLSVRMDVDPEVFSARVPSLILQPVVENAIKHGLAPKIGPGHLNISASRDGRFVKLEVEDDGVGFARSEMAEENERRGVGLKIIAERLKTLYKAGASLHFESASALGSRVTILIPLDAEAL
jgi:two-component system LytT family sensor kinase